MSPYLFNVSERLNRTLKLEMLSERITQLSGVVGFFFSLIIVGYKDNCFSLLMYLRKACDFLC